MSRTVQLVPDPTVVGPVMAFNTGEIVNGVATFYSHRAAIGLAESPWFVVQWVHDQYLDPGNFVVDSPAVWDPTYGTPEYSWTTPNGEQQLNVFWDAATGGYIYDLRESGGNFVGAGANLLMQAMVNQSGATFDHQIDFSLDAKISEATIASVPGTTVDRLVAMVNAGFILEFNATYQANYNPALPTYHVMFQLALSQTENIATYLYPQSYGVEFFAGAGEHATLNVAGEVVNGAPQLEFRADGGALHHLSYNLNYYLDALLAQSTYVDARSATGALPAYLTDMSRWSVQGVYIGPETVNRFPDVQGYSSLGLMFANFDLSIDSASHVQYNPPPIANHSPTIIEAASGPIPTPLSQQCAPLPAPMLVDVRREGMAFGGTISGTASEGSLVAVFDGETLIGHTVVDSDRSWSVVGSNLFTAGPHRFYSIQYDIQGRTSAQSSPIEKAIAFSVSEAGNGFLLHDNDGFAVSLAYNGRAVTDGQFGAWHPVAVAQVGNGFDVAWQGANQLVVWSADHNGNFVGYGSGFLQSSDAAVLNLETHFQRDLNGDGQLGIPVAVAIESLGATHLMAIGGHFALLNDNGNGPTLRYNGSAVANGQFGAWTPIGAELRAGGYRVAWAGADQIAVWNTDSDGNYVSQRVSGMSRCDGAIRPLEGAFHQDLNGDGNIEPPVIQLVQAGATFSLLDIDGAGPALTWHGAPVMGGQFGAWTPLGARLTTGGYQVVWGGSDQLVVWNTDSTGNFTEHATPFMCRYDTAVEAMERDFSLDLNGDSQIGSASMSTVESMGATALVATGVRFSLLDHIGNGPVLQRDGSPVLTGQYGAWRPIGAEQAPFGYEVTWAAGQTYIIWNVDTDGGFIAHATEQLSQHDFALEAAECRFGQDLNGDGRLAVRVETGTSRGDLLDLSHEAAPVTIDLGRNTASVIAGLNAPSLSFMGDPDNVILGAGSTEIEYALGGSSGVETVEHFKFGTDLLNLDMNGIAQDLTFADTTVRGAPAIALFSHADPRCGLVLVDTPSTLTAAALWQDHTLFIGGHALVS